MVTSSTVPSPDAQVIQMTIPDLLPDLPIQRQTSSYSPLCHRRALHSHLPYALPHVHARASAPLDHNTHHGAHHHARARRTRRHMASVVLAWFASVTSAGAGAAQSKNAPPLGRVWVPFPLADGSE
jgi:hypothetical protein